MRAISLLFFTMTIVIITSFPIDSWSGPRIGGNGGDPIVAEFKYIGEQMVKRLRYDYPAGMKKVDLDKMENKVKTATIDPTDDDIYENGDEVTALNFRDLNLIRVNRQRWMTELDPRRVANTVFHEYNGLVDDNDLKYEISSYFLSDAPLSYVIVMATGERAFGPWFCYLRMIEDLASRLLPAGQALTEERQEALLRRYFVAGYEPLSGFNYKYQLSITRYRDFKEKDPTTLTFHLIRMAEQEFGPGAVQPAKAASQLVRAYAREELPVDCRPILKVDPATGLLVGAGRSSVSTR